MKDPSATYSPLVDRLGISASTVCAIHCMALPLLISILPAIGLGFLVETPFEGAMIATSITIAAISLGSSWRTHRRWNALMMMASGALLLIFNFFGHESHAPVIETLHPWIAGLAGLMIASAHWINMRLCRSCATCRVAPVSERSDVEKTKFEVAGDTETDR